MKSLFILLVISGLYSCTSDTSPKNNNTSEQIYVITLPKQKYSKESAMLLGRLYFLANPHMVVTEPAQIANFVELNASNLDENSEVIRCAEELGNLLINQALLTGQNSNPNKDREMMYDIGRSAGVDPEITERAANGITSTSGYAEVVNFGLELIWLSEVIPSAAEGNWNLFINTGTDMRKTFYQMWPLLQAMTYEVESNTDLTKQFMNEIQPIVEYQIFILASMIQN